MREALLRIISFWSLDDPAVRWVLAGSVLLGMSTAVAGCFAFLQKRALAGDMLAHAALPGVTLAFLLVGQRDPITLFVGAAISSALAYATLEFLVSKMRIRQDSALAIVLSSFFALGIFVLTYLQKQGSAAQAGLDKLLFGQAASLVRDDVLILAAVSIGVLLASMLLFRPIRTLLFDRNFALAAGMPVRIYETVLSLLIVVSVVIGLQLMGVVLMAALLVVPAAAARYWSDRMERMLIIAAGMGAIAGVFGAQISYLAPRMPTGPWMVLGLSILFLLSLVFAPTHGLLPHALRRWRQVRRTQEENILRTLFKLGEDDSNPEGVRDPSEVLRYRPMPLALFDRIAHRLWRRELIVRIDGAIALTPTGIKAAALVTRRHRLWERYLTHTISIAPDHVHEDAEEIEHVLTPELEAALVREVGGVGEDPHGRKIPREPDEH